MTARVAIVTGEEAPDLTSDGRRLRERLRDRGIDAEAAVWHDPGTDWAGFDLALVRSCWGYYTDPEGFRDWLASLETAGVTVHNPPEVIRWNIHKSYLLDLERAGVPVVPTEVVSHERERDLVSILEDRGWDEAVVKPAVGTSSAGVWRTTREAAREDQARFAAPFPAARRVGDSASGDRAGRQLSGRDAVVQRFVPAVADGELSLVFLGGEYSHAWRSLRADDALGVEPDGTVAREYDPPIAEVERAADVLRAASGVLGIDPSTLTHARVDGVRHEGAFLLMELELIEPYLNLDRRDGAVDALAATIVSAI